MGSSDGLDEDVKQTKKTHGWRRFLAGLLVAIVLCAAAGNLWYFPKIAATADALGYQRGLQEGTAKGIETGFVKCRDSIRSKQKEEKEVFDRKQKEMREAAKIAARYKKPLPEPSGYVMNGDEIARDEKGNAIPYVAKK